MKVLIKNKKGDIFNLFFLIIILLLIAAIGLIFVVISIRVNQAYSNAHILGNDTYANNANDYIRNTNISSLQIFVLLFFVGGTIGILVGAARTNFSVVMLFLFFIMLGLAVLCASGAVNIYYGMSQNPAISDISQTQFLTNFILGKYMPIIVCVIGAIVLTIMYGKSGSEINV